MPNDQQPNFQGTGGSPDNAGPAFNASSINTNAPFPRTVLSANQIADIAVWAGFSGKALIEITGIALAESSGDTGVINSVGAMGLLQILQSAHPDVSVTQATNPYFAMQWAYNQTKGTYGTAIWYQLWGSDGWFTNQTAYSAAAEGAATQAVANEGKAGLLPGFGQITLGTPGGGVGGNGDQLVISGYAGHLSTLVYGPVKPWTVDEIQVSGFLDSAGNKLTGSLTDMKYGSTNLKNLLLTATVDLSSTESSTLTLTFTHGDYLARDGRMFPSDETSSTIITIRNQIFAVSSVEVTADAANQPQLQVTAMSAGWVALGNAFQANGAGTGSLTPTSGESATQWVGRIWSYYTQQATGGAKMPFYGKDNVVSSATYGSYDPKGDPTTGTPADSALVYLQKLCTALGYWAFEAGGTLYFGPPSVLVQWGNRLMVQYEDASSVPSGQGPIGPPQVSAAIQSTPNGFAAVDLRIVQRQVQVSVPQWYGCQVKPGDCLVLEGFSDNFDTPPGSLPTKTGISNAASNIPPPRDAPKQLYIITEVNFSIDGGLTPVTISAEEAYDPNPQYPNSSLTAGGGAVGSFMNNGNGTTNQVPGLSSNPMGNHLSTDFLDYAESQEGVPYVWGGSNPAGSQTPGFDCSGLVAWACGQVGVSFPRTSQAQWQAIAAAGTQISVNQALNTPGALLFPTDPASAPTHVAIAVGDGTNILQAAHTGTVIGTSPYSQNGWLQEAGLIPGMNYAAEATLQAGLSPDLIAG